MENLDDLTGVTTSPVDLNEIVGQPLPSMTLPEGAVRNKAATLSLLSDPSKVMENYSSIMAERSQGSDSIMQGIERDVQSAVEQEDRGALTSTLADPTVPLGAKMDIVKKFNDDQRRKDYSNILATKTAMAPSEGETVEAEKARIESSSQIFSRVDKERKEIQAMTNAFVADLDSSTPTAMMDITSDIVAPFSTNILMATLEQDMGGTFWSALKAFADPGGKKMDIKQKLADMPFEERKAFTEQLMNALNKRANTLFRSENDFAKFRLAQEIMQGGEYSNTDRWLDTMSGVLDMVGLGVTFRAKNLKTITKQPTATPAVTQAGVQAPIGIVEADLATVVGKPTVGVFDSRIADLEAKKASMLGETGKLLDKGEVSSLKAERSQINSGIPSLNDLTKDIQKEQGITSKDAKAQAKRILDEKNAEVAAQNERIDSLLKGNQEAQTITQRIAALEKEIETLQKNNTPIFLKKTQLAEDISRIEMNGVMRIPNPSSPIEVVKLTNPQIARQMHAALVMSQGDDVALAIAGTNRVQAIANNILPQISVGGKVAAGVVDVERDIRKTLTAPNWIYQAPNLVVDNILTRGEIEAAKAHIVNKFNDATGLTPRTNMGSVGDEMVTADGAKFKIDAVYGPSEGDFLSAKDAMEQTKFALKAIGITEKDVEILAKKGLNYEPVKLADVEGVPGSYLARVKTEHVLDPTDVIRYEDMDVKFNWLDRLSMAQWSTNKSAANLVMDYPSMVSAVISGPMAVGTDKAAKFQKTMIGLADEFASLNNKLSSAEQARLSAYLREANFNQLVFDYSDLKNVRQFSDTAIEAVKKWRSFWDGHYFLENLDIVRTLNVQGWEKFDNGVFEGIARKVQKNSNIKRVYDPDTDVVRELTKTELDALYDNNGFYAMMRRPATIHGELVEHMVVRNNPQAYLRKLNSADKVLNYREGYFQLQYKAARFVDEITILPNGKEHRRAVAVAKDTVEAKRFADRMNANAQFGTIYQQRADDKIIARGSDDWWDVESASGRIAQRHRGKLLESGNGLNHIDGDMSYVLDPVTSAVRAAKSVASRTIMRPVLETAKQRWMQKWGHLVEGDNTGRKMFPAERSEFGTKGGTNTKEMADARTTWNYINSMENGYINGMDEFYKNVLGAIAESAGDKGLGKVQRGVLAATEYSPAQLAKGTAFNTFIAASPLRQLIVQFHQAVRTFAVNPKGWFSGKIPAFSDAYRASKMQGGNVTLPSRYSKSEFKDFAKFVEETGIIDAVDMNVLVKGALLDAADNTAFGKALRASNKPLEWSRQVGFDKGEIGNNVVHLAALYDKYMQEGKDVTDKLVRAEMHSVARAIGYDMNAAGDMVFNQSTGNFVFQFMMVPLKGTYLNFTNRRIPLDIRARLLGMDLLMWGTPAYIIAEAFDADLPEDPVARQIITDGVEAVILDKMAQEITGNDDLRMDWGALAPNGLSGIAKIAHSFLTDGNLKTLGSSPAGQLFGEDGRIRHAMLTMSRFFAGYADMTETPETFANTVQAVGEIFSQVSYATQAWAMLEEEKRRNKYGSESGDVPSTFEAAAMLAGFREKSSTARWEIIQKANADRKQVTEDIRKDVKAIAKYYEGQYGKGIRDPQQYQAVSSLLMKRYEGNMEAWPIIQREIQQMMADPEDQMFKLLLDVSGLKDASSFRERLKDLPVSEMNEEKKRNFIEFTEAIRNQQGK